MVGRSAIRWLGRIVLIGAAGAAVAAPAYLWLGPPIPGRLYGRDEFARFAPSLGHGVGQFVGQTLITLVIVWAGRRWLRIRL